MRLLANENLPAAAIEALRSAGHDVAWVRTDAPGSKDPDVFKRAVAEGRVLLTMDKDFGALAFATARPTPPGIILLRLEPRSPVQVAQVALKAIGSRTDWGGHFAVIEEGRIRLTPLPVQK